MSYITGIKARLSCRYYDSVCANVYISGSPRTYKERHPIAKKFSKYGYEFSLIGKLRSIFRPRLFVKIFHKCSPRRYPMESMIMIEIPRQFIHRGKKITHLYDLGQVELSKPIRRLDFGKLKVERVFN